MRAWAVRVVMVLAVIVISLELREGRIVIAWRMLVIVGESPSSLLLGF